jgi:hypothetical protein
MSLSLSRQRPGMVKCRQSSKGAKLTEREINPGAVIATLNSKRHLQEPDRWLRPRRVTSLPSLAGWHWRHILPSFFRCRTDFWRVVQDVLVGIFILAAIGAAISLGSAGTQLFSP